MNVKGKEKMEYLESLEKSLKAYSPKFSQDKKALFFQVQNKTYELYNNSNAILLFDENNKNLHIIPIMLSHTDTFMLLYIERNITKTKKINKKGQISIFDLGVEL